MVARWKSAERERVRERNIESVPVTDKPAPDVLTAEFVNVGTVIRIVKVTIAELLTAALLLCNLFSVV
mgnify:CR=1 FL=1